jgi:hypothetical protein
MDLKAGLHQLVLFIKRAFGTLPAPWMASARRFLNLNQRRVCVFTSVETANK